MTDLKMSVYSPALDLMGELEVHKSVIWAEKAFSAGSFSVESLITDQSMALLQPENIIWIADDTAGIIEYVHQTAGKTGPYITAKGCDLTGILARRILWGQYELTGTPPAIMHTLVNDCCINPTRGDTEERKIPGLVLLDAPAGGDSIRIQKTGGTLLEALEQLGETYGVAFGVRFNPAVPRMEFWTRWGRDLTVRQSTNPQVFYSTELDDVLTSEYSYNAQDYRNVALVAGEGDGDERTTVTVESEIEEIPDTPVTPPQPPEPVQYTVTLLVDPEGGGMASGGKTVAAGVSITVTAAPSNGYEFVGWKDGNTIVSTTEAYSFTVNENKTLTAVFAAIIPVYTVIVTVDPSGGGVVSGGGTVEQGQSVTLTQAASDGYRFSGWYSGGSLLSTNETYTFTPTANAVITAKFIVIPVYTITAAIDPAGSGTVTGAGQYQEGTQVTITAAPADGYTFSGWKENGVAVSESTTYTFTASSNRTLVAAFAEVPQSRLPAGYTEVEYIFLSKDGLDKACIKTDFILQSANIRIESEWLQREDAPKTTAVKYILGGAYSTSNMWGLGVSGSVGFSMFSTSAKTLTSSHDIRGRKVNIVVDSSENSIKADDYQLFKPSAKIVMNNTRFNLFGGTKDDGSSYSSTMMNLYSCKLYVGDALQVDLVPCINPDGVVGLYDIVRNMFCTNVGTAFTAGPAV